MSTTSRTHRRSRTRIRRWKKEAVRSRGRGSSPVGEMEPRGARWGGAAGWLIGADVLALEAERREQKRTLEATGVFGDPGSQEVLNYIQQASYVEAYEQSQDDASLADPHLATAARMPGEGAYERGLAMHLDLALGRLSRRGLRTVTGRLSGRDSLIAFIKILEKLDGVAKVNSPVSNLLKKEDAGFSLELELKAK